MLPASPIAPGARVEIRGLEWIVRRVDSTSTGGVSIAATGVSELVRGREARFLSEIEGKGIVLLDPAETTLVPDPSPQFRDTRLYLEALLRQSPPTGSGIWIGHRAAMDLLPFQLEPALQALDQPRPRILMADAVGLGKTIEVGILLAELIRRGKGKRILAVTGKSMMTQFQKELWSRFTIPLVRLDSTGVQRIRNLLPANANPFHHFDRAIISIDTLKQENEYRVFLENASWDVIVIDEAHRVAERGNPNKLNYKLARLLATRSDALIMTSATPHDGRAESFASLMNMLDPTAIANPSDYGESDIRGLHVRRFKKDVTSQLGASLKERRILRARVAASPEEEAAFEVLAELSFESFDRRRRPGQHLFRTVLEKALFSSPAACRQTIRERLRKLEGLTSDAASQDRDSLTRLDTAVAAITPDRFTRYQRLLTLLRSPAEMGWTGSDTKDRLVIFTERIETLKFLRENLARDLGLSASQIAEIYGQDSSDRELQETVEDFGREKSPVRLLLATDMASEGLNLHFLCRKMVHFDTPWSFIVFQQRNGRIDRYGQEREPLIAYLFVTSKTHRIEGDARILELLAMKDAEAQKNIGDPTAFYGVYEETAEEAITATAMEEGVGPERFESWVDSKKVERTEKAPLNLLEILFGSTAPTGTAKVLEETHALPSLFPDDLAFCRQALDAIKKENRLEWRFDSEMKALEVQPHEDLRRAFRALPKEALPEDGTIWFTIDRDRVKRAIRDCRSEERRWPDVHLLWDLHPFVEWLGHRLLVAFQRREAPVVVLRGALAPGEAIFLMQGEIPNQKGHPAVHAWFGVRYERGVFAGTLTLDACLSRTQFATKVFANTGVTPDLIPIQSLVKDAVESAREFLLARCHEFRERHKTRLSEHLANLTRLKERQSEQLEKDFPESAGLNRMQRAKKDERRRQIARVFDDHVTWVKETMTVEDQPYLRLSAVFTGEAN